MSIGYQCHSIPARERGYKSYERKGLVWLQEKTYLVASCHLLLEEMASNRIVMASNLAASCYLKEPKKAQGATREVLKVQIDSPDLQRSTVTDWRWLFR